jgi:hypothetical protein
MSTPMSHATQHMQNSMGGNDEASKEEIMEALDSIIMEAALRGCDWAKIIKMVHTNFTECGPGTDAYDEAQEVYAAI